MTLSDDSISGEYGAMAFAGGKATFKLRGGESAVATGLPTGVTYTVEEVPADGLVATSEGATGTLAKAASVAAFTNTRETGDLTVSKAVVSDAKADKERFYNFTIRLSDETIAGTYGDLVFSGGVATVSLKGGQSATAEGLPTGVTYEVQERGVSGMNNESEGAAGIISTEGAQAKFTNTRRTGDLEVTKEVVSDAAADAERAFNFTVTLFDDTITGVYGDMTFANGVANFSLKGGQTAQATGLPTDVAYTVSERGVAGFTTDSANETGTIAEEPSSVTFTNTRTTGELTVRKSVTSSTAADHTKKYKFTVSLSDTTIGGGQGKAYGDMIFTNGVATFELADNQSVTATGLPTDVEYTVTEEAVDGFVTTKTGDTGTISTTPTTSAFTNARDEGGLEVTKTIVSDAAVDANARFEFTVTLSGKGAKDVTGAYGEMTFTAGVATFTLGNGEALVATGLPKGLSYAVTEKAKDDFVTKATGATGTVSDESVSLVSFTNTRKTGDVAISKTVVSDAAADADATYDFTIELSDKTISGTYGDLTFDEGVAHVTLKGGETKTAKGLPVGVTYTVAEEKADGFTTESEGATGTIATTASEAQFTNTREVGDLTLSKKVVSEAAADAKREFKFTIELSDKTISGTYGDLTFTAGFAHVSLKGGESKTAKGLPTGVEYEVTETADDDFTTDATGAKGTIATEAHTAAFTNTRKLGDLTVNKTVVSSTARDHTKKFSFTVTLVDTTIGGTEGKKYGDMTFKNGVATFELADGETATATGLPTGIGYTVTERTATGFVTTKTGDAGSITTTPATAAFTNARDEGGLQVSKTVVSDAAADSNQTFAFTVTLDDEGVSGTYGDMTFENGVAKLSLKGGQIARATGLPKGANYSVTEDKVDGFITTSEDSSGKIGDKVSVAAFTNTRETGDLTLSKAVVSDAKADKNQSFDFTVKLFDETIAGTYGDMTFSAGVAHVTLKGGESATAKGLPTSVRYEVTEAAKTGFTTKSSGETGTIATTPSIAAFTNTRETGELTVSKAVVSDAAADANREFGFTVTIHDDSIAGTYGDMTFAAGVAHVTLKGGESKTATGLPTDVAYTVTEDAATGFTTVSTGATGTIATTASEAAFTNTRKLGEIVVSKMVTTSTAADYARDFTFTVTLGDSTISKAYGTTTFTNGVATFTLKHDESRTISGLPTGVEYTVAEQTAEGFVTIGSGTTGVVADEAARASFTNAKEEGGLTVTKHVTSPLAAEKDNKYSITVTLADTSVNGAYGEMNFKDGVAKLELADGETATARGLAKGIGYTVSEKADDHFVTTYTGKTGAIAKDVMAVAEVTNTRKTGDLTVSKEVVSDAAADADVTFDFVVTLSDEAINGTFGDMDFTRGVARVTLKGGESKRATGLPTDVTYEVTEAQATGFTTESEGATGTISATASEAKFTNTRETGDLEVSKRVVSEAAADRDQKFAFTVELSDKTISKKYGDVEFANGVATFELRGGESKTATGLPTGVGYTVTEGVAGGFDTEKAGDAGTISTKKSVATFTNTRKLGDLTVTKTVASDAKADHTKKFAFTVTLSDATIGGEEGKAYGDMTFANGKATFELADGETLTATGLPTGLTYSVTEAKADGFFATATGETGTISTSTSEAGFTNTRDKGGLVVAKKVVSDAAADKKQRFSFKVTLDDKTIGGAEGKQYGGMTFKNGVATFELAGGESLAAKDLPTGVAYTVEETSIDGFVTTSEGATGTLAKMASLVKFTNTRETGDLTVSKKLVSDAKADKTRGFDFTIKLSDETISGTYGDMTFDAGVANVTLKGGERKTANGLPTGVGYTVTEAKATGFTTASDGAEGTINTGGETAKFTNTREVGDLEVSKTVASDAAADHTKDFSFTVTLSDDSINGEYGDMTFTKGVATFTLKDAETKTAAGLPTDIIYTVTEDDAPGFTTASEGATGIIAAAKSTATFRNARKTGGLTVSKSVTSNTGADHTKQFDFTVTLSDTSITGTYGEMAFENGVAKFKLSDRQAKVAQGLPTDVTYTVEETAADGFVTTKSGDVGTIATTASEAKFANTRDEGGLQVTKTVVSDAAIDADARFSFTVTLTGKGAEDVDGGYGAMTFKKGVATFELGNGETKVATGLPRGLGYRVVETQLVDFTTEVEHASGSIGESLSVASFTNTRKTGDLTVSKAVVSDAAADKNQEFSFTVTLSDKTISGVYGDLTFDEGVAHAALKGGETKTAKGLPVGIDYAVTEAKATGFTTESEGAEGTIATTASEAKFTNTRETGDLEVSKKVVSEAAADKDREFVFTVKLDDTTINGTYGDMKFAEGTAQVTLKGGEKAVAKGLPTDVRYTVTEVTDEGFNTSSEGVTGAIATKKSVAAFTNTRKVGELEVSKKVVSDAKADHTKKFSFTVTLSDKTIGGEEGKQYGDMTFKNGKATFSLADGESRRAEGLPTSITYTVTETADDDFKTNQTGEKGQITTNPATAIFTNTRDKGGLVVSKKVVSDAAADKTQKFSFKVTLSDNTIGGTEGKKYGAMTFKNGVAEFELANGESLAASELPTGITYTVEETTVDGLVATSVGETGTISKKASEAKFTNTREKGDLTVSKTVVSDATADKSQKFVFTIELSDKTISGKYKDMNFDKGNATVTLKGGESKTAKGLPTGITYTVTETAVDGLDATSKGAEGTIATTASEAAFTNTRQTGDLVLSKELVSRIEADAEREFKFTVKLTDEGISKTFGDMTFEKGVAHVTLKGGESATATGLPTGIGYTITEDGVSTSDFAVEHTGETGQITTTTAEAKFTNTRLLGSLRLQKIVQVNDKASETNYADGTYSFTITGPGAYKDGVTRTITIANGKSETLRLDDLFVGKYTIVENSEGLPANMRLMGEAELKVEVTANNEESIPTATFINNLKTTEAILEVTKEFNNWEGAKTNTFPFSLTPVNGAPMAAGLAMPGADTKTATADDHIAHFDAITFSHAGTYAYDIREVVPADATNAEGKSYADCNDEEKQNGTFVKDGVTYDAKAHKAQVLVTADEDGALTAEVKYDENKDGLAVTNAYAAAGQFPLSGTKELLGRKFREGDKWTFTVSQPDGQDAPMPKTTEVTVDATKSNVIDFGTIEGFDFEDVGKTYTYIVTESGKVENVINDTQKEVKLTVEDNGDGTLSVHTVKEADEQSGAQDENAEDEADEQGGAEEEAATFGFVNRYQVKQPLEVLKGIEGRKWKLNEKGEVAEDYSFELYDGDELSASKRKESDVASEATTRGGDHKASFGTFEFTSDDLGNTYRYTVREMPAAEGVDNGVTNDPTIYDVTYEVVEEEGELKVRTTYEAGKKTEESLRFLNKYQAKPTTAHIEASKVLGGRAIAEGEFEFELYFRTSAGKETLEQTKSTSRARETDAYDAARATDTQSVMFDDIDCIKAGTETYVIKEVIPTDAEQRPDGTWVKDGVTYDTTAHVVRVVTTDDNDGQLHANVVYEDLAEGSERPTFINTYFGAEASIGFDKEYYGTNDTAKFGFTLTAADDGFKARESGDGGTQVYDETNIGKTGKLVDFGQAFKVRVSNGEFKKNVAEVKMPTITYHKPGTYRYVIAEDAGQNTRVANDTAEILVTVVVDEHAKAAVSYQLRNGDEVVDIAADERPTLYNNGLVAMGFRSAALRAQSDRMAVASFEPAVNKVLENGYLKGGEFEFALYAGTNATGNALQTARNDANGRVAFGAIEYDASDVGKTYTYTVIENNLKDEAIAYDTDAITINVSVAQGSDGALETKATYSKHDANGAIVETDTPSTFMNRYNSIVLRTWKKSREEPHDPLPGAHYGLWMINPGGEDVYMGLGRDRENAEGAKLESNVDGELYYDIPPLEGVAYYFKEEWPPPAGHLVDPYPTDYFTLVYDEEAKAFRIVYETDPLFKEKCPDVVLRP
ncbi:MAG: hypothetical protein IKG21_01270 [Atopobiaceae bacterium]|nr:hypothetical protein [Atopobiaceae bacterium]